MNYFIIICSMTFYGYPHFYYMAPPAIPLFHSGLGNISPEPQIKMEEIQNFHSEPIKQEKELKKEDQCRKQRPIAKRRKKKKCKEEEYGIKGQKEDRNLFSNSLKIFLKYVRDMREANPETLNAIFSQVGNDYTIQEFYSDLEKRIPKNLTYIGASSTARLAVGDECEKPFSKMFRLLIKYFYSKEMYPAVLTSKKIIGKAKAVQINGGRTVFSRLLCLED